MQKFQIDASTWATLNRLLDEALEQPATQLPQWLSDLAPEFDALKPRLNELLSRSGLIETGEFLHTLPKLELEPGDLAAAPGRAEQPGQEIGLYRLVRELGSGGMGVVWLAERIDGLIDRPVALKLPHGAWKRAGLAERMARERTILASLTHPNIAHLYDAGVTGDGQPYLAIEYVEGRAIDLYCREQQLDVKARLRLFAQVVNAIAYAHGKLVVHRDLKPANILVSAEGQVRLLDFGIAKLLDEGRAKETRFTELSGRALTPDYASPEQILGEPLTVTSDVYSLGVVLYELLSDRRPYKLQRDSRGALEDAILQADPAPPSNVAGPRYKSMRGDLDTIVLKALRKKPADRYPTAHALLDDIERYLGSRPVLAQPDSRWYRARKFVARNKVAVSAAGAIFLAVLAGAGIATWQAGVALAEKTRAEETQKLIAGIFREADPMQGAGKSLSAVELLLQAERRLRTRPDISPMQQIELLAIVGESLFGLQDNQGSARVLGEALRMQESLSARDPATTARLHLALSQSYEYLGRNDDAVAELTRCFEALAEGKLKTSTLSVRAKLHEAALGLATHDYTLAERAANEAHAAASAIIGPRSEETATALQLLSKAYIFSKRAPLALERSRQALDLMLANYGGNYSHPRVIESAQYYANALIHVGDFDDAATLMRDITSRAASVLGDDSRLVGELSAISIPAELERGDVRAAVALARRAVDINKKEAAPDTPAYIYRVRLLGVTLLTARDAGAIDKLNEDLLLSTSANRGVAFTRASLGLALAHAGRFSEAEAQLSQAIEASAPRSRPAHIAQRNFGTLLRLRGEFASALEWLERANAAAAHDATNYFHRNDLAAGLVEAGLTRLELRDPTAAASDFARAEQLFAETHGERLTPSRADLRLGSARVKMMGRDFAAALPALQQADRYWRESRAESRWAGETALWLGRCYVELGRTTDANEALRRAQRVLARSSLPGDARLAREARRDLST